MKALALTAVVVTELVAAMPAHGRSATASAATQGDALQRLARVIRDEVEPVRADFAALALDEIIAAYEMEFDLLSRQGQVSRRELAKQARWARALSAFLDELYLAREALDAGASVEVLSQPPAPVQLMVGERVVPVSSPRIGGPESLDDTIAALFCETYACGPGILEPVPPPAPPQRASAVGGWSFRDGYGSTYETVDGLGFMFSDVRHRGLKEDACRQVRDDLLRLVDVLAAWRRPVDFNLMRLEAGPGDNVVRVVLTRQGESLSVQLPALSRAPGVLEVARDWVHARVRGREHRQLFPRAELLLAGLLDAP